MQLTTASLRRREQADTGPAVGWLFRGMLPRDGLPAALLVLATLLLPVARSGADTLWCRTLDVEEGLSQNYVTTLAEDQAGFMWSGTLGGLSRWDGYQFVRYTHDFASDRSLSDAVILAMHVDDTGRLWVGTKDGLDLFDPASETFRRHAVSYGPEEFPGPRAEGVTSDPSGRIWVASFIGGNLFRHDPRTGQDTVFHLPDSAAQWVTALHVDQADRLWVATQPAGNNPATDREVHLLLLDHCSKVGDTPMLPMREPLPLVNAGGKVVTLVGDRAHRLWIGQDGGGLTRFDPRNGETRSLAIDPNRPDALAGGIVRHAALGPEGEIWAMTSTPPKEGSDSLERLHRVDADTLTVRRLEVLETSIRSGSDAKPTRLAVNRSGVLWVGSNGGGLRYADISSGGFDVFRRKSAVAAGLNSSFVRAICADHSGAVWVGTPVGLNRVDRSGVETRYASSPAPGLPELPDPNVQAIHEDRRRQLWIGTPRGLVEFDPVTGGSVHHRHEADNPCSLADDWVQVIHEDPRGRLWLGTLGKGLEEFDLQRRCFTHSPGNLHDPAALPSGTVHALFTDSRGNLWVGTSAGLARLEEPADGVRRFHRIAGLADRMVFSLAESTATPGILWAGTQQHGLCRVDLRDESCRFITTRDSDLPNDTVYAVLPDTQGRLWLSSNQGLARFAPAAQTFETFGAERGLQSSEFNARAFFRAPDGELFFGGVGGFNAFRPERITRNPYPPRVLITDVGITDRSARNPEAAIVSLYRQGAPPRPEPRIPHRQRDLTFDFVALHYSIASANRCEYRLDGYDQDWQRPVTERRVRYTNLEPGRYTFRVRAVSGHGVRSEGEATYSFVVLPPVYGTLWFRTAAGMGMIALLLGGHRFRLRGIRRQQAVLEREVAARTGELRRALATVEAQACRLEALDSAKSKFFANISHEFRTPLMLTLGPLRDVQAGIHGPVRDDARAEIEVALRNSRRLLELVDQLLMLARFDAGESEFRPTALRLDGYLRDIATTYTDLAQRQSVRLQIEIPAAGVHGRYDPAKLDQVFGNLLGNALKFTPAGGTVTLRLAHATDGWATVEVEDTGPGIPPQDLPRIFERFYRGEQDNGSLPGTGLGLALARECVELHGGDLRAENLPDRGARFTVRLPAAPVSTEDPPPATDLATA